MTLVIGIGVLNFYLANKQPNQKEEEEMKKIITGLFVFMIAMALGACGEHTPPPATPAKVEAKKEEMKNLRIENKSGLIAVAIQNKDLDGTGAVGKYVTADIASIGVGSDTGGWPGNSTSYPRVAFNSSVTETIVEGLKAESDGSLRLTPFLVMKDGKENWVNLKKWTVNSASTAIVDDGSGGLIIKVKLADLPVVAGSANPNPATEAIVTFELIKGSNLCNIHIPTSKLVSEYLMDAVIAGSIAKVFWGSKPSDWGDKSSAWTTYNSAVTDTVIANVPLESGRATGNFGIITTGNAVDYARLEKWQTSPAGGISSDGRPGGLHIDLELTP